MINDSGIIKDTSHSHNFLSPTPQHLKLSIERMPVTERSYIELGVNYHWTKNEVFH